MATRTQSNMHPESLLLLLDWKVLMPHPLNVQPATWKQSSTLKKHTRVQETVPAKPAAGYRMLTGLIPVSLNTPRPRILIFYFEAVPASKLARGLVQQESGGVGGVGGVGPWTIRSHCCTSWATLPHIKDVAVARGQTREHWKINCSILYSAIRSHHARKYSYDRSLVISNTKLGVPARVGQNKTTASLIDATF
jgi:hypothetical protein